VKKKSPWLSGKYSIKKLLDIYHPWQTAIG